MSDVSSVSRERLPSAAKLLGAFFPPLYYINEKPGTRDDWLQSGTLVGLYTEKKTACTDSPVRRESAAGVLSDQTRTNDYYSGIYTGARTGARLISFRRSDGA